jgi:hypothetical protein
MDSCPSNQPAATPASIVGGQRVGLEDDLNGHRSGVASANHHSATSRKPRLTRPRDAGPTTWGHRTNGTNRDFAGALRAIETAVAMGFAVDDTVELPSGYVPGEVTRHDQWRWPRPYRSYAELLARGGELAKVAEVHRLAWISMVEGVSDGAAALFIGHGGGIEPALVASLPDADYDSWEALFAHCDGARLGFDQGRFMSIQFRRAPAAMPT